MVQPVFDKRALHSDATPDYIFPWEPKPYSRVAVRLRTGRYGVLRCGVLLRDGAWHDMLKYGEDAEFSYYTAILELDDNPLEYCFEVFSCEGEKVFYARNGFMESLERAVYWKIVPGFAVPEWMVGAVTYQIYVDRFCNGDPSNDVLTDEYQYLGAHAQRIGDWGQYPQPNDIHEFYGGDLQGVIDKLPYLQDLGVQAIYLNPIFVSPSNHKYDCQDYDHIDPHIGKIVCDEGELLPPGEGRNELASRYISRVTNPANLRASDELFIRLVREAHRRGIRVILDGVFNHCGSFHKWMDRERIYEQLPGEPKGAYLTADSAYRSYFRFYSEQWPCNGNYEGWWGHETLPKLCYEDSPELFEHVMRIAAKWVSAPYHADGWRLDVAADLGRSPEYNHFFWKSFRRAVKEANPEAVVLAEHYGDPQPWLQGDEWDTVMNYDAFMEPVTWFLTGMEKHSDDRREDLYGNPDAFWRAMLRRNCGEITELPSFISMNELSNHDHSRFLTRTNRKVGRSNSLGSAAADEGVNKAVLREAVVIQMTWPGAPTIYYGDEAGLCGFTDPDNRRTYPWGREDQELIAFHRELIRIHKAYACLRHGSVCPLTSASHFISYGRFCRKEAVIVAVNNNAWETTQELEVIYAGAPRNGRLRLLFLSDAQGYRTGEEEESAEVQDGILRLTLPANSAVIYATK
ncbi:MAG: alpha-glycosidase [Eubacteriales bacterium]|nr:alpha-glycosidase [Eubacteriales bacterium]